MTTVGLIVRLEARPGKEEEVATGRQAHPAGPVAAGLGQRGDELFAQPPTVETVEVLAEKR